jgi:Mannosyl-glycoprotein endo-beta-N-acetylglucosaminidase
MVGRGLVRPSSLFRRVLLVISVLVASSLLAGVAAASPSHIRSSSPVPASPTTTQGTSSPTPARPAKGSPAKGSPAKGSKAKKAKTKPVKPFVEPRQIVMALLGTLSSEERQLLGLGTYSQAQAYLRQAQHRSASAKAALAAAESVLAAARAAERRSLQAETSARASVHLYESALYELGMAEYTGEAATQGTDLASQEREIDFSQLSDVAAVSGSQGLARAETALAAAIRLVGIDRTRVSVAARATARANGVLVLAEAQVARSHDALLAVRSWATVPGRAPSRPYQTLLILESAHRGKAAKLVAGGMRGAHASVAGLRAKPGGTSDRASITTTAVPGTTSSTVPGRTSSPGAARGGAKRSSSWLPADAGGPSILGEPLLSASDMAGWFISTGQQANTTVPIGKLARYYLEAARPTGVRGDVAFAQSIIETGYFSFPSYGQDAAGYNNFAGIGACDHCKHGWKFSSARAGVTTQESLLSQYAEPPPLYGPPGGLAAGLGVAGCCRTWMGLSGIWASNPNYGYEILSVYQEMVDWAIAFELQKTGLLPGAPTGAVVLAAPEQSGNKR